MSTTLTPLRLRPFRRLAATYAVNGLGDWFGEIALTTLVCARTHSALAVAALWAIHQGFGGSLAPLVVARVERHATACVLPLLLLAQASIFCVLGLLVAAPRIPLTVLLALAGVDGVIAPVVRSLTRASVVATTRPVGLHREGNALLNIAFTVNAAAGPAVGGVLVAIAGVQATLLADAGSFLVCAGLLRIAAGLPRPATGPRERAPGLRAIVAGLRLDAISSRMLAAESAGVIFVSMIVPIEIVFVTEVLDGGAAAYGLVLTAWGAGMVAGGALSARLRRVPLLSLVVAGGVAMATAYAGMGTGASLAIVVAWSVIGGAGNGVHAMAFLTALQERAGDAQQARVASLYDAVTTVGPGIGFLLGGALASIASPRIVYLVASAGAFAAIGWAVAGARKQLSVWRPAPLTTTGRAS
jgi:predicted MFS family arabinose efflux permease